MKEGYFDPQDHNSVKKCLRKWDEFIVARYMGQKGHELPPSRLGIQPEHGEGWDPVTGPRATFFCLLSCVELAHAVSYLDENNLRDDPDICLYHVTDGSCEKLDLSQP